MATLFSGMSFARARESDRAKDRPMLAARALVVTLSQSEARVGDLLVAILLVRLLNPGEWAGIALLLSIHAAAAA
jgi:hypothetical protein